MECTICRYHICTMYTCTHIYHVIVLMEELSDCLSFQKMVRTKPLRVVPMSPTIDSTSQRNLIGCLLPPKFIHYNLNYVIINY